MVVLGSSPEDLQNSLDNLYNYCNTWSLSVNTDKTKIVAFRKRGKLKANERWFYNGQEIEVVNDFNYLGVVFNCFGSFISNQQYVTGKALKAMNVLNFHLRKFCLSPIESIQLFDTFVTSVLNYGGQIWGLNKSKAIERIHLKFLKGLLRVKITTSNAGVYGVLGRYPIYINRFVLAIKYWFKILFTGNILLRAIYNSLLDDLGTENNNWLAMIKNLLVENGFQYVWVNPWSVNQKSFLTEFKQRLIDNFVQSFHSDLRNNKVLTLYSLIKIDFSCSAYLNIIRNQSLRCFLTKLRLSSHSLRIETGRYGNVRVDRSLRICTFYDSQEVEDEFHFVLICNRYTDLRKRFLQKYYYNRPNMYKFILLLQKSKRKTLLNLCYYLRKAFARRTSLKHFSQ